MWIHDLIDILVIAICALLCAAERSADLSATPPFTLLAPNLPGQPDTTSFMDTNAASLAPLFYRVGVGP